MERNVKFQLELGKNKDMIIFLSKDLLDSQFDSRKESLVGKQVVSK